MATLTERAQAIRASWGAKNKPALSSLGAESGNSAAVPTSYEKNEFNERSPAGLSLLADFAGSRAVLRIRSAVLAEEVVFAADNADVARSGLVVYRARELALLMAAGPDALRVIHEAKRLFAPASVVAGEEEEGTEKTKGSAPACKSGV